VPNRVVGGGNEGKEENFIPLPLKIKATSMPEIGISLLFLGVPSEFYAYNFFKNNIK